MHEACGDVSLDAAEWRPIRARGRAERLIGYRQAGDWSSSWRMDCNLASSSVARQVGTLEHL
jgi:hypothetical protein